MIDFRGATVEGPDAYGYFHLRRPGYIHPTYFSVLPGTLEHDSGAVMAPCNAIPPETAAKDEVPFQTTSGLRMRNYQRDAIRFCLRAEGGALLALDVGLGKTLVATAVAALRPELRPVLIAGPLITLSIWTGADSDATKHWGLNFVPLRTVSAGPDKMPAFIERDGTRAPVDGYFINFEIADDWQLWLEALKPRLVIVDESHVMRTAKIKASRTLRKICRMKTTQRRLLLTATPIVNRVSDLWAQLDALQPGMWGNKMDWGVRYAGFIPDPGGYAPWLETGEMNTSELRQRLSNVMVRVSRFEARKELPAFQREVVRIPPDALDQKHYKRLMSAKQNPVRYVLEKQGTLLGLTLQQANALHKELSHAKAKPAADIAYEMAQQFGKIVVFCWYKETTAAVVKALSKHDDLVVYGPIDSTKSRAYRDKAAKAFRDFDGGNGPLFDATHSGERATQQVDLGERVTLAAFVATLGTSGMSLNELAAAPVELFVDLYWVPWIFLQAEGRIHREGQKAACCYAKYLTVEGSIDEVMFSLLTKKAQVIANVSNSGDAISLTDALGGSNATSKSDFEAFVEALQKVRGTGEL